MTKPTRKDIEITKEVLKELYEQVQTMSIKGKACVCNEVSAVLALVEGMAAQPASLTKEKVWNIINVYTGVRKI